MKIIYLSLFLVLIAPLISEAMTVKEAYEVLEKYKTTHITDPKITEKDRQLVAEAKFTIKNSGSKKKFFFPTFKCCQTYLLKSGPFPGVYGSCADSRDQYSMCQSLGIPYTPYQNCIMGSDRCPGNQY